MKTIIINAKTARGLDVSIRKWERVVATACDGRGTEGCGLCTLFNKWGGWCKGCPIELDTGESGCRGTPYDMYENASDNYRTPAILMLAKDELNYLIGLKARCEVVKGATNHVKEA